MYVSWPGNIGAKICVNTGWIISMTERTKNDKKKIVFRWQKFVERCNNFTLCTSKSHTRSVSWFGREFLYSFFFGQPKNLSWFLFLFALLFNGQIYQYLFLMFMLFVNVFSEIKMNFRGCRSSTWMECDNTLFMLKFFSDFIFQ